jgi:heat shock protein HslJ
VSESRTLLAACIMVGLGAAACASAERAAPKPVSLVRPLAIAESGSLAALAGRHWVLREWDRGERFAGTPVVTLTYTAGRFAGRAGCNRYTADAKAGAAAGDVAVGPIATTRMMCPEPGMAVERRYLDALTAARRWALVPSGDLTLTYATERGTATLVFSEVAAVRSD